MKLFKKMKDGGPYSRVIGYFLIEWKRLFSIALLRFDSGSREAYHTHAFNSVSWVLSGALWESNYEDDPKVYMPSFVPVVTRRNTFHKVDGLTRRTWVLTFRGPWSRYWKEFDPTTDRMTTLTHGREKVAG